MRSGIKCVETLDTNKVKMKFNEYKSMEQNGEVNVDNDKLITLHVTYEQLKSIVNSLRTKWEATRKFDSQLGKDESHPMNEEQLNAMHRINEYEINVIKSLLDYINRNSDNWMSIFINTYNECDKDPWKTVEKMNELEVIDIKR